MPRNAVLSAKLLYAARSRTPFASNEGLKSSSGLHFYPTSYGVIQNQRRKIRRILSSEYEYKDVYFSHSACDLVLAHVATSFVTFSISLIVQAVSVSRAVFMSLVPLPGDPRLCWRET